MPVEDEFAFCDFCHQQGVNWQTEEMAFRQWSDRGYVHCRVEVAVGTCPSCGTKSLRPGSDQVLDAAFQDGYRKLPKPPDSIT
jgi:hypothetical protein